MKNYEVIKGKQWQIGDVTIYSLYEDEYVFPFENGFRWILPTARLEPSEIDWLVPDFATEAFDMKIGIQSFLIKSKGKNILVDNGEFKQDGVWESNLNAAGCSPEDIDYVMFTHLHDDHVSRNTKIGVMCTLLPTFTNARYLFYKENYDWIKGLYDHPERRKGFPQYDQTWTYLLNVLPLVEQGKVDFIDETFTLNDEISLYPTPGHMPGMVAIVVKSKGDSAMISGDFCHNPIQFTQLDVAAKWDVDPELGVETRKKVLAELAGTDMIFFASHFTGNHGGFIVEDGKGAYRLKVA